MRITEITAKNEQWSILKDINFSKIAQSYNTIIKVWPIISADKSSARRALHIGYFEIFLDELQATLNEIESFPDQNDQDLIFIKHKINSYIVYLQSIIK